MNPTFGAYQKAMMQVAINMFMGIPYVPRKRESINNGPAFATSDRNDAGFPRSDLIEMAEEAKAEEDARNVREYLDKLEAEVRGRANGVGYPK